MRRWLAMRARTGRSAEPRDSINPFARTLSSGGRAGEFSFQIGLHVQEFEAQHGM